MTGRGATAEDAESSAGGEASAHTREGEGRALAEAVEAPPERDLEVYTDEGVLGLRIPVYDPGGRSLEHLHSAMDRVRRGEGQARITFYGASHVAADWFTGYLREHLQTRFGDAGHGLILPAQPWRHYRHLHAEVKSNHRYWDAHRIRTGHWELGRYGVYGVAVESDRSGAWGEVGTVDYGDIGRSVSRFELYYLRQPGGGAFDVYVDGRRVERVETAADDFEPAYAVFDVEDGPHRLKVRVRGDGPVRVFGVDMRRDEPGVVVDALGINGARARSHLLWEDALYREHLARLAPDLIVLAYGTNEAGDDDVPIEDYEGRLREVVGRVREVLPDSSCLLIGPSDRPIREGEEVLDRPRTAQLIEVQRRVSADLGCGFFDMVAFMGGPLSMPAWVEEGYGAPDHIHFTRDGYDRFGEALMDALFRDWDGFAEPADENEALAGR